MAVPRSELEATWREERRQARQRILDCTRRLLRDRPWPQLSLQEIMRAAELSRTAFYRHFDDRDQLLFALLGDLRDAFVSAGADWKQGCEDPIPALRRGLHEVTTVFADHGHVLQALVDAASESQQLSDAYDEMVDGLVHDTSARIAAERAAGRSDIADPDGIARALLRMNERFLLDLYGRAAGPDPEQAAAVLGEVWTRTIYRS
jgi:AcrR family transcriptional regulator